MEELQAENLRLLEEKNAVVRENWQLQKRIYELEDELDKLAAAELAKMPQFTLEDMGKIRQGIEKKQAELEAKNAAGCRKTSGRI